MLRKVAIGLISTGSELRDPGEPLGRGQIYNSNRIMIRAMLSAYPWAEIVDYGIVPDRQDALAEAFGEAASRCDVLVTTGGVSAGEEDHVVSALGHHGGTLDVLKVAMRPGKPVKIGTDRVDALRRTAWQSQRGARDLPPDRPACDPDDRRPHGCGTGVVAGSRRVRL